MKHAIEIKLANLRVMEAQFSLIYVSYVIDSIKYTHNFHVLLKDQRFTVII